MKNQLEYYTNKLSFEVDSWDLSLLINENVIVIDTRSHVAYAMEHIPGALNLPHKEMNDKTTQHINRSALIITYCDGIGCNASTKGAFKMAQLGFTVKELIGGLDWWKRDSYSTAGTKGVQTDNKMACGC